MMEGVELLELQCKQKIGPGLCSFARAQESPAKKARRTNLFIYLGHCLIWFVRSKGRRKHSMSMLISDWYDCDCSLLRSMVRCSTWGEAAKGWFLFLGTRWSKRPSLTSRTLLSTGLLSHSSKWSSKALVSLSGRDCKAHQENVQLWEAH